MTGPLVWLSRVIQRPVVLATSIALAAALMVSTGASAARAAAPACFGAAARDPKYPCSNPTRSVTPAVADSDRPSSSPCEAVEGMPEPQVCTFGAPAAHATGRVALVGDSHALHWRAALDVTARAQGWQAFSITRAGCMFFAGSQALPEPLRVPCMTWNQSVLAWFRDHPEVSTVFVSQAAVNPVVAAPGKTRLESTITGFQRAWRALPNSVEHIIVIRDTPNSTPATLHCVRRVVRAGNRRPGPACRLRRYVATRRDAAIIAAKRLRSPRFQVVGLNEFFCSRRYCYPVIGGVLVDRDGGGHITVAYSRTLGPYLLRKVRRLTAFW